MNLTLQILNDAQAVAGCAADLIAAQVQEKPDSRLLVATGQTPMATYEELARRAESGAVDFSRAWAVQLDEYSGLAEGDPRSLKGWMERSFVVPLGVGNVLPLTEPAAYDRELAALGGIDLAILGLGPNGHLGFNEPPSPPDAPTRAVQLTPESLASNRAYWPGQAVPTGAVTAGMSTILAAQRVLLLVTGEHKRDILQRALHGPETPLLPASFLRRTALTVIADRAAWC